MTAQLQSSLGLAVSDDPLPNKGEALYPAAAATDVGWAVAWSAEMGIGSQAVGFAERLANGMTACTHSIPMADKTFVGGVAARGNARLVAYSSEQAGGATDSVLARFNRDCTGLVTTKIAEQAFGSTVAWSNHSVVALSAGSTGLQAWVSGPNLCDQPVP